MSRPSLASAASSGGISLQKARSYIHGGAVYRDDSDDELGDEDIPWEWIYETDKPLTGAEHGASKLNSEALATASNDAAFDTSPQAPTPRKRGRPAKNKTTATAAAPAATGSTNPPVAGPKIIGARLGKFECYAGDAVLLKADAKEAWVGLICSFFEEEGNENEKMANVMWFSNFQEIRNEKRKRTEVLENELYITPSWDDNPLTSINGKARILSPAEFAKKYPSGRVSKNDPGYGKTFICRFGCNTRTTTYTKEFVWEKVYRGPDDLGSLIELVQTQTEATRKPKTSTAASVKAKIANARAKIQKKRVPKAKNLDGVVDMSDDDSEFSAHVAAQDAKRGISSRKRPKKGRGDGGDSDDDDEEYVLCPSGDEYGRVGLHTPRKRQRTAEPMSASKRTGTGMTPRKKLLTPTHKRTIVRRPLEFTPLGSRILSTHALQSPFQQARNQLHVSSVPMALPCREDEFAAVYAQLETAITEGTGSCIYIAGTPGTGKTATVREVVAQLNAAVMEEELDDFIFVEINGMKVTDPHQAYSLLWEALRGERVSPSQALRLLEAEFSGPSPRRVPCVVLMDELDQLVTKDQSVMYNFFNWPGLRHSRLIVLAVANTMDLPERTLSNKISSRLGLHRITFRGYTHEQLMQIIESRLANVPGNLVHPDAIQFAARKVAAVSGDARRALDICRRAVEIAEEGQLARQRQEEQENADARYGDGGETEDGSKRNTFRIERDHDMSIIQEEEEGLEDEGDDVRAEQELQKLKDSAAGKPFLEPAQAHRSSSHGNTRNDSNTATTNVIPATPSRVRTAPASGPYTPSRTNRNNNPDSIPFPPTPIRLTPLHKRANLAAVPGIVTIAVIKQAITEATSSPLQQSLRALPLAAKLFLAALVARSRRTGVQEAVIGDVIDEARGMGMSMLGPVAKSGITSGGVAGMPVAYLVLNSAMLYQGQPGLAGFGGDDSAGFGDVGDEDKGFGLADPDLAAANGARNGFGTGAITTPLSTGMRGRPKAKKSQKLLQKNAYLPRLLGLRDASQQLLDAGFLGLEARRGERVGRVRLGISEEEVGLALRGDADMVGLNLAFLNG